MKCRSLARVVENEQSSPTPEVVDGRNAAFRRRLRMSLRAQLPEQRCEPRSPPPKIQETAVAAGDSHATQPMKGKRRSPPPDADVGVSLKSKIFPRRRRSIEKTRGSVRCFSFRVPATPAVDLARPEVAENAVADGRVDSNSIEGVDERAATIGERPQGNDRQRRD